MRLRTDRRFAYCLLPICALVLWPLPVMADGGTVRLLERNGNYQIAIFTLPTPLRAGTVDISVLIQNAATQEPAMDVQVTVKASLRDHPYFLICHPATTEAATNKLFRAAMFELPTPGWWEFEVSIDGPLGSSQARFEVEVAEPLPQYLALWPWVCWPVLPIVLFGMHQFLMRQSFR